MANSDWESSVTRAVAFSLASYTLGLGLFLSPYCAVVKTNHGADLDRVDGAIELGGPCMWAILSAAEWSFIYITALMCIRVPLMAVPVLFCGVASTASLAHMTQSAVKSHNGPADRLQSVGGACR